MVGFDLAVELKAFSVKVFHFMPQLVVAVVIFLLFIWAGRCLSKLVERQMRRLPRAEESVIMLMAKAVRIVAVVFGSIVSFKHIGVDVSAIIAGLGLTGFALGFALRDSVSNIMAGLMILIYRPYKVGDRILVGGNQGRIERVDLRYTTLVGEGKKFLIPNANLFTNTVEVIEESTVLAAEEPNSED
jgi:small conductance mechanosensitive channel